MTFVRGSLMYDTHSQKRAYGDGGCRGRTLDGRTIECFKNYLLIYGLSPRLLLLISLSLSLSLSLSFRFSLPPFALSVSSFLSPSLSHRPCPAASSHNHKEYNGWKPLAAFHCHFFVPPINFHGTDLVPQGAHSTAANG